MQYSSWVKGLFSRISYNSWWVVSISETKFNKSRFSFRFSFCLTYKTLWVFVAKEDSLHAFDLLSRNWRCVSLKSVLNMKQPTSEEDKKNSRETLNSLCSVSALLLSVACCMALIHVELRIQEHHRLISHSVTVCDQMETQILRKVQQNYERWQVTKVDDIKGHLQGTNGKENFCKMFWFLMLTSACFRSWRLWNLSLFNIMYRSNRSFNNPPSPPPPGIPRAFDTFAVPGRREFDYQCLPGGGEFDPYALGVGNLNCTLDFMWNLWRGELHGGHGVRGFSWKRLCLCGQLWC